MNIARVVEPPARADPRRAALIIRDETVSYGRLEEAGRRCAAALHARGIVRGDRVPLADATSVASVGTVLGAARLGAVAAPMNPHLTPGELRVLADVAGCKPVGVAGDEFAGRLGEALGAPALRPADLLSTVPLDDEPLEDDAADALVLFTSGTSGTPKAVAMTHGMITARIQTFAPPFDPSVPAAVAITCVPMVHVGGLLGLLVGFASGSTLVVQRRFDAGEWLRLVERHRVSRAFLVPTMLRRILDHPERTRADLSSLQMITSGAAPLTPDLAARVAETLPHVMLVNVFGQTETLGAITAAGPDDHRRAGSVGRPLPGVEIRIVDPSLGTDVAEGDVGEVWVRAPFLGRADWHRTGDLARRDGEGYLYPAGRLSDTINRGGEKLAPSEVEAVLRSHPQVADAAVAGVPDVEMGERVGAIVVPRGPVTADELRTWCRARLAHFKAPERIAFVDELPYNELGKVPRRAVVEVLATRAAGP